MDFNVPYELDGLPVTILVTDYHNNKPFSGSSWNCDNDIDYYGGFCYSFTVEDAFGKSVSYTDSKELEKVVEKYVNTFFDMYMD